MVLLLAAVALNKTWFGLVLVVAFSVGLAITLSAIGIVFLYARNRIGRHIGGARWPRLLPVLSAASIAVLGALLCYGTLSGLPI
jgi:ABC-type nickel/cobalt efflux system permease component RcnA